MSLLKNAARQVLHTSGALRYFRNRSKNAVRILMYHNFPADSSILRRQCEHIRRYYSPVAMRGISDAIHRGGAIPGNAVAITVDDGYRDFLENAYPVFAEFEIPATVFLVTDFLDRKKLLWWDEIQQALVQTQRGTVDWPLLGTTRKLIPRSAEAKQQAYDIAQDLKDLPDSERRKSIATLLHLLGVPSPSNFSGEFAPMSWDEVRTLTRNQVEFGAHTRTHPILSKIEDRGHLRDEILSSRDRLVAELGQPVLHFCYPNGRERDIGPTVLEVIREGGFETAVTTVEGMNRLNSSANPFLLKRLGVSPLMNLQYFAELLAGVRRA